MQMLSNSLPEVLGRLRFTYLHILLELIESVGSHYSSSLLFDAEGDGLILCEFFSRL